MSEEINESVKKENAAALNAPQTSNRKRSSIPHFGGSGFGSTNRCIIAIIVYLALLLDNILLTVIVPILPDYLANLDNHTLYTRTTPSGAVSRDSVYFNAASRNQHLDPPMTKHPIPRKSMVNSSMSHQIDDKIAQNLLAYEQKQQQQQYLTLNGNNSNNNNTSLDIIKIVTTLKNNSSMHQNVPATSFNQWTNKEIMSSNEDDTLSDENGSIGLLLAMKALVQLIFNPIVGNLSSKFGYRLPIVMGTFCLLFSSLVFAVGETYATLLLGRAIQGIGSACIGVCGMSLVAQLYPEEERRSKVMGIILGSIALGVLIGYPLGGFLYDLSGKSTPFAILSTLIFLNLGMQLVAMDLSIQPEFVLDMDHEKPKWKTLFESKMILAIIVAIWFSTSTMAILEPCLPIWLIQKLKPTKWQLGTVFIPDSIGYFVGTNFFGSFAYKFGQIKISCISLILVGISAILIPNAQSVGQLLLPHFCLGLGIGIIDAALVPLLATFVDATLAHEDSNDIDGTSGAPMSSYGTVYCLQQTSVSLAYCLAPLIGGELAQAFGFAWLMRIVGFFNVIYGPILVYLYRKYDPKDCSDNMAHSAKPFGPGPGAYMLPTTVGFDKHDNRKNRLPQYSFGARTRLQDRNVGPGPGAYQVDKYTRYGPSKGVEYTMAPRNPIKDRSFGPGPGAHDVHVKPFFKGVTAPSYTMAPRNGIEIKSWTPGANAYGVDVSPIKHAYPSYSMGARLKYISKVGSPGPAAYGANTLNVFLDRKPEFSMAKRLEYKSKIVSPGPNNYNLMYYRPGKTGKSYSFGVRHSPYAPPMIVKCDNM